MRDMLKFWLIEKRFIIGKCKLILISLYLKSYIFSFNALTIQWTLFKINFSLKNSSFYTLTLYFIT